MKKIKLIVLIAFLISADSYAFADPEGGEKHALIIGVGKYKSGNGWNQLHADNDVEVVKHALITCGFREDNLISIINEKATKAGMLDAFLRLLNSIHTGDIVVIHYSGHGQQISDLNGDEPDGLDEALVPHDAPSRIPETDKNYRGSLHFTDDELSDWFDKIRNKIGKTGELLVFVDACHSGTASRGNSIIRGGVEPLRFSGQSTNINTKNIETSGYEQAGNLVVNKGRFILIAATRSQDLDYEHPTENIGSLTYAMADALENKVRATKNTYRDLFEYIRNTMAVIVPGQTPQIEGDIDLAIFNGKIVIQQPFYKVLNEQKNGLFAISAGKILALKKGTKVGFYPIGTRTTADRQPVIRGVIEEVENLKSYIRTDRKISIDSLVLLQAFIMSTVYEKNQVRVFIQSDLPADIKTGIIARFERSKVEITGNKTEAHIIISKKGNLIHLINASDGSYLVDPFLAEGEIPVFLCGGAEGQPMKPADFIVSIIARYSKSVILKKIDFNDNNLRLSIKVVPDADTVTGLSVPRSNITTSAFNKNAKANIIITNTGTRAGYVYLVEFDPTGKICELIGFDTEIRLEPGRQDVTAVEFVPPLGRYLIKGYMTEEPIGNELRWLINTQVGEKGIAGNRGNANELINLLGGIMENPVKARTGVVRSGGVTVTNFSYDLLK